MQKKVVVIHTSFVSVQHLKELFSEIVPEVKMVNIVDDSLLDEVKANGYVTPGIIRRVCDYAVHAQDIGADLIFNQCSSMGEAVNVARKLVKIPYIKVDEPMMEEACRLGTRILLVATVASTVAPSARLLKETAEKLNKQVVVQECLVNGALDVLMKTGDVEKHNQMVIGEIKKAEKDVDVVVLAQGSMVVLLPYLKDIKVPVLTSPRLGVERIREYIK